MVLVGIKTACGPVLAFRPVRMRPSTTLFERSPRFGPFRGERIPCRTNRTRLFEWDAAKARANLNKHGIDFADVAPVFEDDRAITMTDHLTAVDEQRFLTVGRDARGQVLVVAYTWRRPRSGIFLCPPGDRA